MRIPPTFCPNNQHIHWTARKQHWHVLQQYCIVRLHIKTHISHAEKLHFHKLTESGFLRELCHSPVLTDQTEPSPDKVSLFHSLVCRFLFSIQNAGRDNWQHFYMLHFSALHMSRNFEILTGGELPLPSGMEFLHSFSVKVMVKCLQT